MSQWAALLGALGLVAFGFGLLSAILALFQPVTDIAWVWGNLVVGALLLGAAVFANLETLRNRIQSGEGRRVGKYGSSAVIQTIAGIAILGLLGFLTTRYSHRFDWSESKEHTLSDQTQKVLEGLEEEVSLTALFNPLDGPSVRDLLDRFDHASERVTLQFADPTARPDLVRSMGVEDQDLARGLVRIATGSDSVDVAGEFSESALTNAIVKLTRSGTKRVYFLEGHNEKPATGAAAEEPRGYSRARTSLENEAYQVESLLLAAVGEVPEDADVVIVAGPTRPLLDHEHAALRHYLERGGALLAMIDPRANTDLVDDLADWGVAVGEDVIVDRQLAIFGRATTPFAGSYAPEHPITKEMRETTLFHVARSVRPADEQATDFEAIVSTGADSWAERDLAGWEESGKAVYQEGADLLGPVAVAVAGRPRLESASEGDVESEEEAPEPRLVVYGDSNFASNEYLDGFRNRDLFLNSINWLMGDSEHIAIRPNLARASRFQLTADQFRRVQFLALFGMPQAIAVLGVFAWWSRRATPEA